MVRAKGTGEPRKPGSGGARTGTPGASYQNRTDLRTTQAPQATPNQTYGQAGQQLQAQAQMPLSRVPPVPSPPGGAPGPGGPAPSGPGAVAAMLGGGGPGPNDVTPLNAPTQRPGEPVTAGLAGGPGPGPEALRPPDPLAKAAAILNALGATADAQTQRLRAQVNAHLNNQGAA